MQHLRKTFSEYARTFLTGRPDFDRNIQLKLDHTLRVADFTAALCRRHFAGDAALARQAAAAALCHDWSRFEQLRQFNTFNDAASFNHGRRSRELIESQHRLDVLAPEERTAVAFAVEFHNALTPPPPPSPAAGRLLAIVRDADKFDIIRILAGCAAAPDNPTVTLELIPDRRLSPEIEERLRRGEAPAYSELRTTADFFASRLLWAGELNFSFTREAFRRDGCFRRLAAAVAPSPVVSALLAAAESALESGERSAE